MEESAIVGARVCVGWGWGCKVLVGVKLRPID